MRLTLALPRALLLAGILTSGAGSLAQSPTQESQTADPLVAGFENPPLEARPLAWWHWMVGFITKEGITADLKSMKRIGLGGAQMFDIRLGMNGPDGQRLEGPVKFMSAEWRDLVKHAVAECHRLGLEISVLNAQGWGQAGGEHVPPAESMQKVVWTDTPVEGGQKLALSSLPQPEALEGFYQDIAVLAFPTLVGDEATSSPVVSCSEPDIPTVDFSKPDATLTIPIPMPETPKWVQLSFDREHTFSSITVAITKMRDTPEPGDWEQTVLIDEAARTALKAMKGPKYWELQASKDGTSFEPARRIATHGTTTFPPLTGKAFRIWMPVPPPLARPLPLSRDNKVVFTDIRLAGPRLDQAEARVGKIIDGNVRKFSTNPVAPEAAIRPDEVINLTGQTEWTAPPGQWTVSRIGHTSTGAKLAAAGKRGGLEVDKLSRTAVTSHLKNGMARAVVEDSAQFAGTTLKNIFCDSWEHGYQNWTALMREEFKKRRGYDLDPWLPTFTGRVVESPEQSERFLWDLRRTIADLVAEGYYGALGEFAHANKLGLYAEAAGHGLPAVVDQLQNKGQTDTPMGEFWLGRRDVDDTKECASSSHIYGKKMAAAEAFTSDSRYAWTMDPNMMKAEGDLQFCMGINRFCFHRFAHQPWLDRAPGMTLGMWGTNFERTNTWWEQAKDWISYLSRSQFLLQQGMFVADACYYYGEDTPVGFDFDELEPKLPPGYDFDVLNTEILKQMKVADGRLTLPSGMAYRVLVLPNQDRMTLDTIEVVRDLVKAGATVVGPKPRLSPSLKDYGKGDEKLQAIAQEIWGDCDGKTVTSHAYGSGCIKWGVPMAEVLGVPPDFTCEDPNVRYIHRRDGDTEIYFVSNQTDKEVLLPMGFRVKGLAPELWHPDTGRRDLPAMYSTKGDVTTLPIHLDPSGSVFVIFRKPASSNPVALINDDAEKPVAVHSPILQNGKIAMTVDQPGKYIVVMADGKRIPVTAGGIPASLPIRGPWLVKFPPKLGAPDSATFDQLASWTTSNDPGVRYFSGTATYVKEFTVPEGWLTPGAKFYLDLGRVMNLAQVTLNGRDLGVLWKKPFQIEITSALKADANKLEIKVTNLWPNRLIGDASLPLEQRVTWTSYNNYTKDSPLLESGLLGPVAIKAARVVEVSP